MTQSLQITRFGGPEVLNLREVPSPMLIPTGIRIQVTASGINFADLLMRMGNYPEAPKPPFTPGYEIAGTVTEVGSSVQSLRPGDRVVAACRFGGYTREIVLPEFQVRKIPKGLSDIEAAAIPVNFMTAWMALHEMARVRKGDRVLVQSAAGGVGIAAVQLATLAGAQVTGVVGSKKKFDVVRSLGAKEVLTQKEWESRTDKDLDKFQTILECTGGQSIKRSFRRLAPTGRMVIYGVSSIVSGEKRSLPKLLSTLLQMPLYTPIRLMMENKGVFGLNMLQIFEDSKANSSQADSLMTRSFDPILERFEDKSLKVIVGKTFPLEQGGEAHSYLQSRANIGKVVLTSGG